MRLNGALLLQSIHSCILSLPICQTLYTLFYFLASILPVISQTSLSAFLFLSRFSNHKKYVFTIQTHGNKSVMSEFEKQLHLYQLFLWHKLCSLTTAIYSIWSCKVSKCVTYQRYQTNPTAVLLTKKTPYIWGQFEGQKWVKTKKRKIRLLSKERIFISTIKMGLKI